MVSPGLWRTSTRTSDRKVANFCIIIQDISELELRVFSTDDICHLERLILIKRAGVRQRSRELI